MTDLTEKWKNKKLELHKSYYCQNKKGDVCIATLMNDNTLYSQELGGNLNFEYWEVLAPVPSYEEWKELKEASDGLSNLMFKSLMNRFIKADEERERLAEENQQLKELLKECREKLDWLNGGYVVWGGELTDFIEEIDNAIGEK